MLAIGEFSRVTHLSVRTLRRYHDAGLLEPAVVDPASGYRSYRVEQIPTAQIIHRLRELDVPLRDVQRILDSPDPEARAVLVAQHLQRLESELDRTRAAVASLRRLLQPEPAPLAVDLRAVAETTVAAVEDDVDHDQVLAWYAGATAELDAVVGEPTGPPGGLYDNSLFESGRGHVLVYLPTASPPRSGRVRPVTLPAVELAVATHVGAHDDIDVTYGELGAWVSANGLAVAGPVRETYLAGPRDTTDATSWRTNRVAGLPARAALRTMLRRHRRGGSISPSARSNQQSPYTSPRSGSNQALGSQRAVTTTSSPRRDEGGRRGTVARPGTVPDGWDSAVRSSRTARVPVRSGSGQGERLDRPQHHGEPFRRSLVGAAPTERRTRMTDPAAGASHR